MSDHAINTGIAAAAGVFFATLTGMLQAAGADLWAAVVLASAGVAALIAGSNALAKRRG
jgi:hypothetical protein